jgi:hypothetical protein
MTAHVNMGQGANLQAVRRQIAWLDRLQVLRRAALPLAAIGALLGVMFDPIVFPLVAALILLVLIVGTLRARAAGPQLLANLDNLQRADFVQEAELARLRSAVDRVTRGHGSEWSSMV